MHGVSENEAGSVWMSLRDIGISRECDDRLWRKNGQVSHLLIIAKAKKSDRNVDGWKLEMTRLRKVNEAKSIDAPTPRLDT